MTWSRPSAEARRVQRTAERNRTMKALASTRGRPSVMGGETAGPEPKPKPYRDRALLDMARGRCCLFTALCQGGGAQWETVAAHSNRLAHGRGRGRKADDQYTAWACFACHRWFDRGNGTRSQLDAFWERAHSRQIEAWRTVAADGCEPQRFRDAALRALAMLNALEGHTKGLAA